VSDGRRSVGDVRAYQLKITLERITPAIWRRVVVPGNLNFARLHGVIQDAMGWEWCHLHEFEVGKLRIGPDPEDDGFGPPVGDERQYTLERLFEGKARFRYVYDFGDNWGHEIRVEKVMDAEGTFAPRCVAGERACPPEDCGGAWGYQDLVNALARPRSKRYREVRDWIGDEWTPEAFDLDAADRRVAQHMPQPGRRRGRGRPAARAHL
jgi:hypothetical protein